MVNIFNGPVSLGFGAMRLPSGADECRRMFDAYLNGGFNYFDTAYVYGGSEEKLKDGLAKRHNRDTYLLADKLPPWMVNGDKDSDRLLNESLKRCGVDYFDFYLVHSLDEGNAKKSEQTGIFEWAARQKKKGVIRHAGFSFHGSADLLERLLTSHPEMEFVQLQLNYLDVLRGQASELQKIANKHKKPIIVMEPVRGGSLAKLPEEAEKILKAHAPGLSAASWAMRYAAGLEGATCVLSGMSTLEQVEDNLSVFNPFKPLSEEEHALLEKALLEFSKIASIPCTACKYCVADCPQHIAIPVCFSLYNELKRGGSHWNLKGLYDAIEPGNRAGDCTACGTCLSHCPQHIDIPKELKTAAGAFK